MSGIDETCTSDRNSWRNRLKMKKYLIYIELLVYYWIPHIAGPNVDESLLDFSKLKRLDIDIRLLKGGSSLSLGQITKIIEHSWKSPMYAEFLNEVFRQGLIPNNMTKLLGYGGAWVDLMARFY